MGPRSKAPTRLRARGRRLPQRSAALPLPERTGRGCVAQPVPPPAGQCPGPADGLGLFPLFCRNPKRSPNPPKESRLNSLFAKSGVTAEAARGWTGSNEPLRPCPEESARASFV